MSSTTSSSIVPSSTQSSPPGAIWPALEDHRGVITIVNFILSILLLFTLFYYWAYLIPRKRQEYNNTEIPLTTTPTECHLSATDKDLASVRSDWLRKLLDKFRNRQTSKVEDV